MDAALLDTDILTEFFKGQNTVVRGYADAYLQTHGQFAISAFTHYEIVRGLLFKNASSKLNAFDALCQGVQIFPITGEVLIRAADLWVAGRRDRRHVHWRRHRRDERRGQVAARLARPRHRRRNRPRRGDRQQDRHRDRDLALSFGGDLPVAGMSRTAPCSAGVLPAEPSSLGVA